VGVGRVNVRAPVTGHPTVGGLRDTAATACSSILIRSRPDTKSVRQTDSAPASGQSVSRITTRTSRPSVRPSVWLSRRLTAAAAACGFAAEVRPVSQLDRHHATGRRVQLTARRCTSRPCHRRTTTSSPRCVSSEVSHRQLCAGDAAVGLDKILTRRATV